MGQVRAGRHEKRNKNSDKRTERTPEWALDKCKVDGCDRRVNYKTQQVCQMHYFRMMRTGSYDAKEVKNRSKHSSGYYLVKKPGHPLTKSRKDDYVYEHRYKIYEKNKGKCPPCELCKKKLNWKNIHVDHIDENRGNNDLNNLRSLCPACNTWRTKIKKEDKSKHKINYKGEVKNIWDWSRDPRVSITAYNILKRIERGESIEDALFKESRTGKIRTKRKKSTKEIVREEIKQQEARIC